MTLENTVENRGQRQYCSARYLIEVVMMRRVSKYCTNLAWEIKCVSYCVKRRGKCGRTSSLGDQWRKSTITVMAIFSFLV